MPKKPEPAKKSAAVDEQPKTTGPGETAASRETPVDLARIERAVREILSAVGEDPERDGLRETPSRVAKMYAEVFGG